MYLENINGPSDVKKLTIEEMNKLAAEMRDALLKRASIHGGHFGPNFGMVEATIALHYVLNPLRIRWYMMCHTRHTRTRCSQEEKMLIFMRNIMMTFRDIPIRMKANMTF